MTERQIQYFLTVCDLGNISAAADKLYVSRPVISRMIKELEEEYGATLVLRTKKGITLTPQGQVIYDLAKSLEANYAHANKKMEELSATHQQQCLRIGFTPTNAYAIYHRFLSSYIRQYPQIKLIMEEYSAYASVQELLSHHLDAFFTPVKPEEKGFGCIELLSNPVELGMRRDDPLTAYKQIDIADIADLPIGVLASRVPFEGVMNAYLSNRNKKLNIIVRTSDQRLLQQLTGQGYIYSLLTRETMCSWEDIATRPISFIPPSVNRLVWLRASESDPVLREFIQYFSRL